MRVFACWGKLIYCHCWLQQCCSFGGGAVSAKIRFFFPLNAFYGELSCQHMGSAFFYSFQTALLSSTASFISKLLESSGEMKAGAGVLAQCCLAERTVFPLFFTKEARQENDSTLSIIKLAEHLNHLLAIRCQGPKATPSSCKMERMAATCRRTTGSSVQFSAALWLTRMHAGAVRLVGKESGGELGLHCGAL